MPTIKLDINTGIEYAPTDGVDSAVKLHNFSVGTDGSLYKLPLLKNLKNTHHKNITPGVVPPNPTVAWPYRLLDMQKFQTTAIEKTVPIPGGVTSDSYEFHESEMYRRFVYLTTASYGVVNINYDGVRVSPPTGSEKFGEFEYDVFKYEPSGDTAKVDLSSLNPKILVDFNAQYRDADGKVVDKPLHQMRAVFPMQYMWQSKTQTNYNLLLDPQNIIHCSMDPTTNDPDIKPLTIFDEKNSEREINDLARGCLLIGNRMFFYSAYENAIYPSAPNIFTEQMKGENTAAFKITPPEEIQAITEFNGNIITFTPTGIERWVLSGDAATILQRDATLHFDHRVRYGGSFTKANRDLYYYTDDFQVYRLSTDLKVTSIFDGNLPIYKPLENYLVKDQDLPMAYFKMLGYRFVSIGPWLYNIDSNTWSTYSYDGWKKPSNPFFSDWIWENDTTKRTISTAYDDIICTYSTITSPLTYKQMQDVPEADLIEPQLTEGKYQWGEVSFFTTRMFQDERTFSLDGVEAYVRGGLLPKGSKMWLKVLRGADLGDFDEEDESTYGIPAYYEPIDPTLLGESSSEHVGHFIWRMNLKTDRFRLQFITKEPRGIVVQSVLANITHISDSQSYLVDSKMKGQEKQV